MNFIKMFQKGSADINDSLAETMLQKVAEKLISNGVKSVFITTDKDGQIKMDFHKEETKCIPLVEFNQMLKTIINQ